MFETSMGSFRDPKNGAPSIHRRELLRRAAALTIVLELGWPLRGLALPQAAPATGKPDSETSTLQARVRKIIVANLGVDEKDVIPTAKLKADLGADSLDIVELCMAIEEAFDLIIHDEEVCKWKLVSDVIATVQSGLEKKQPQPPHA